MLTVAFGTEAKSEVCVCVVGSLEVEGKTLSSGGSGPARGERATAAALGEVV